MTLIEWDDSFSVGVADIDHEHKGLIELINQLYSNVQQGASEEDIEDFFGEIYTHVSAHFALEEKIMRDNNYPEYQAHKQDHERLLEEIRDMMDDYTDQMLIDEQDLSTRLRNWFSEHFKTMDSRLHKALHA